MPKPSNSIDRARHNDDAWGLHLLGYLASGFGLGESARHTLRHLNHLGIPVTAKDVDTWDDEVARVEEFRDQLESRRNYWPRKINLFHLNPPDVERLLNGQYSSIPLSSRLNVIVPFWELPALPPNWLPVLESMDCILAPTHFIREVISENFPDKLILHYPQSIPIPEIGEADRRSFGFTENEFIFLCAFDAMSDPERKNPWASITAFKKAFPASENVRLVLKVGNAHAIDILGQLREAIKGDSRITILTERLSHQKLQSLYASCDALVSLHRSEGLGLFIMEMMAMAKPTIVTAWSGNMDFTTASNSCLVAASKVPVYSKHPAYEHATKQQDVYWVEADTEEAATWMKKLVADPELCAQIGQKARETMVDRASTDYSKVFETIQQLALTRPTRSKETQRYFRKIKRRHFVRGIEHVVKRLVRGKNYKRRKKAAEF